MRTARQQLNDMARQIAKMAPNEASLEAIVAEAKRLEKWLRDQGYEDPRTALAVGVQAPPDFRLTTIADLADAADAVEEYRRQRGFGPAPRGIFSDERGAWDSPTPAADA